MSDTNGLGNEIASTLSASQKGKIVEQLVGATCVLQSDGRLRVSVPLVDDEGVDLIVSDKNTDKVLLLQIKSRFTLHNGNYRTDVRRVALHDLGKTMWLVPSLKRKWKDWGQIFILDCLPLAIVSRNGYCRGVRSCNPTFHLYSKDLRVYLR